MDGKHKKCLRHIPPFVLVIIFVSIYYMYLIGFCHLIIKNLLHSCLYLLFNNILFIMLAWSFVATVFTPIMQVPEEYKLSVEEDEEFFSSNDQKKYILLATICRKRNLIVQTRTSNGHIRYCRKCRQIKPDRAHHCSSCETCVLKMDHHCPWANNCIGFSTEKFFVLLLFYASIYCIYVACTTLQYFCAYWDHRNKEYILVVINFLIALFLEVLLGAFFLFHCGLVLKNVTTLEQIQTEDTLIERNVNFNIGQLKNFKEVFGDDWRKWLLPIYTTKGNGCTFPTAIPS